MDYLKELPVWPFTIIAALLGILGAIGVQRSNRRRTAASIFRNEVLSSLNGIYPTIAVYRTEEEINTAIIKSIPAITTAAAVFSHHLPFCRKRGFKRATQKYSDTARKTDWNEIRAYQMFPNTTFGKQNTMEEDVKHCVDNLLSYAKEK